MCCSFRSEVCTEFTAKSVKHVLLVCFPFPFYEVDFALCLMMEVFYLSSKSTEAGLWLTLCLGLCSPTSCSVYRLLDGLSLSTSLGINSLLTSSVTSKLLTAASFLWVTVYISANNVFTQAVRRITATDKSSSRIKDSKRIKWLFTKQRQKDGESVNASRSEDRRVHVSDGVLARDLRALSLS